MKKFLLTLLTLVVLLPVGVSADETCNHEWSDWEITEQPSCIAGSKSRWCSECGEEEVVEIPANGKHEWSDWDTENPTCDEDGYKNRWCYKCDKEENIKLPATGKHVWSKWKVYVDADCISNGEMERECKVCGELQEKIIPKTGHKFGKWSTIEKPSALYPGFKERICSSCGEVQSKDIPKLKATVRFSKKVYKIKRNKKLKAKISYTRFDYIKSCKSSNKKIATINKKGIIRAKKKGTVKITIVTRAGATATCKVKVK